MLYVTITILIALISTDTVLSQCRVNIRENIATKDPVFMKKSGDKYELWAPDGPSLTWSAGETTYIVCSGSGNSITLNDRTYSPITCSSGQSFLLDGKPQNTIDFQCEVSNTGVDKQISLPCWQDTAYIQTIGFNLNTISNGFVTYIDVCYSMVTGSAKYSRHIIPGKAIAYSVVVSERPTFKSSGTAAHVSAASSYTQNNQFYRLEKLLGSEEQAGKFINSNSYLARGHLTPAGDGIFRSWQFATFFYINVAPQWQVVNAGNWVRVENAARSKASKSQADLIIFTGTEGILTLPHLDGREISISLDGPGNIEVPKWFWKIIKNPLTNSGIALVTLNNPFATSADSLCSDICSSYGWDNVNYADYSKGFTYCCSVESLMTAVPGIPNEASVGSILSF